jgi:PKHD-type hydroxylase
MATKVTRILSGAGEITAQADVNAQAVRTQGTAFFFPSFLEHQATMVTKGTRYSLACWFDGPKWC